MKFKFSPSLMVYALIVLLGVQHYSHHWCIAISAVAALFYLKEALE